MEYRNGIDLVEGNSSPWVFLVAHNINLLSSQKVCQIFQIEAKKIDEEIFFYSKATDVNHKEKSLILFYAALYLGCSNRKSSFCLGQFSILGEIIRIGDLRPSLDHLNELQSEDWKEWTPVEGKLWISEAPKIYLEHAGIGTQDQVIDIYSWVSNNLSLKKDSFLKRAS